MPPTAWVQACGCRNRDGSAPIRQPPTQPESCALDGGSSVFVQGVLGGAQGVRDLVSGSNTLRGILESAGFVLDEVLQDAGLALEVKTAFLTVSAHYCCSRTCMLSFMAASAGVPAFECSRQSRFQRAEFTISRVPYCPKRVLSICRSMRCVLNKIRQ